MRSIYFLLSVFLFLSVEGLSQALPQGNPSPSSNGYMRYGYVRADSGMLVPRRDTLWTPIRPAMVYWENVSVDTAFWYYDMIRWNKFDFSEAEVYVDSVYFRSGEETDTLFYTRNGVEYDFYVLDIISYGLLSGGNIVIDSLGCYNVSPATFRINKTRYTSTESNVCLDPCDSLPRIDVIYADTSGWVGVLKGGADSLPLKPQVDESYQVELSFVIVSCNDGDSTFSFPEYVHFGIGEKVLGVPHFAFDSTFGVLRIAQNRTNAGDFSLINNNPATYRIKAKGSIATNTNFVVAGNGGLLWETFGWQRRQILNMNNARSLYVTGDLGAGTVMNNGDNLNFFAIYDSAATRPLVFESPLLNQFVVSVNSQRRGMLIPRVTTARMNLIGGLYRDAAGNMSGLQQGMIVYNVDSSKLCWSTPSGWQCASSGSVDTSNFVFDIGFRAGSILDTLYYTNANGETDFYTIVVRDGLISGGIVTYTGFALDYFVSAAVFRKDGQFYTTNDTVVTLPPLANVDSSRTDVFVVNTSGEATSIQGVESANPLMPQINSDTDIFLTSITLTPANQSAGVDTSIVYDEDNVPPEWQGTSSGLGSFNLQGTTNVYRGAFTTDVGAINNNDIIEYTNSALVNQTDFNGISFFLRLKQVMPNNNNLALSFWNGTTQVSNELNIPLNKSNTTNYQGISMGFGGFTWSNNFFNKVRYRYVGGGAGISGFYLDFVYLQNGIAPVLPTDNQIILTGDISGVGVTGSPVITTLSTTGVTAGTYGAGDSIPVFTVDAKGRITNAFNVAAPTGGGADSSVFATLYRLDTAKTNIRNEISGKLNISDTATMNANFIYGIGAGTNVTVDNTNPRFPIVSASGGGGDSTAFTIIESVNDTTATWVRHDGTKDTLVIRAVGGSALDTTNLSYRIDTLGNNLDTSKVNIRNEIPAQFNPIAGANITLSGTYPSITFNATQVDTTSLSNRINLKLDFSDTANLSLRLDTLSNVGGSGIDQLTGDVTAGPGSGSQAATITANAVTYAKMQQMVGLSVLGNGTNASANMAAITAGTDHDVLRLNGTTLGFGKLNIAGIDATGALSSANFLRGDGVWAQPLSVNIGNSNLTVTAPSIRHLNLATRDFYINGNSVADPRSFFYIGTGTGGGASSQVYASANNSTYTRTSQVFLNAGSSNTNQIARIAAYNTSGTGDGQMELDIQPLSVTLKSSGALVPLTITDALTTLNTPLRFQQYGSTGLTGTATKWLAVDASGNVIQENPPAGGGSFVDSIYRKSGQDSIFYTINNVERAIKDSVGSGGGSTDTTSLSNRIDLKLNISDTATMLTPYALLTEVPAQFNPIAGANITLSGTYPSITFNATGGGSADSTTFATNYRVDTAKTNIRNSIPIANSTLNNKLSADVTMAATNTWYTGATVSLPSAGTYFISGNLTFVRNATTAQQYQARICTSDGTTVYASGQTYQASVNGATANLHLSTLVTVTGATDIVIQGASSTSTNNLIKAALTINGQGNNATQLTAIRTE